MVKLFTKENMARLTKGERGYLMYLQMSPSSTGYSGGGYLPDDCSECGACGTAMLGTGWCGYCSDEFEWLRNKALGTT